MTNETPTRRPPPSQRWLRLHSLAAVLLLAGCVTPGPQQGPGSIAAGLSAVLPRGLPPDLPLPRAGPAPAPAPSSMVAPGTPPISTRTPQGVSALLARGTVRGDELLNEVVAVRQHLQQQRSLGAIAGLTGSLDAMAARPADISTGLGDAALRLAIEALLQSMRGQAMGVAFNALDNHLAMMIDDPSLLRRETIRLPAPDGLTAVQQQRAVTMGAMVVMSRVTNHVLAKARQDFQGIEAEYLRLLGRRESAAQVLYQALARGASGREQVAAALRPVDMEFLEGGLSRMPLSEFARDLGAQNVALSYLARTDPGAFADYRVQAEGVLGRARGYQRLASGAVAFGAMTGVFAQETLGAVRGRQAVEILTLLPMATEFVAEAPALVKVALEAGGEGVRVPFRSSKRFRVAQGDAGAVEVGSAAEVFADLERREAAAALRESLFRNGSPGLLYKMFLCSPGEAGRLLDAAVPATDRDAFARAFVAPDATRYSFANVLEAPPERRRPKEQDLGDELLREDQRDRARSIDIARLQRKVSDGGYRGWSSEQLLRLIFTNREGRTEHATLQLGTVSVRPIASAESVFAYESLVDACRGLVQHAAPAVKAAPAPAAAAPLPGRAPQPQRPVRPPAAPPATR